MLPEVFLIRPYTACYRLLGIATATTPATGDAPANRDHTTTPRQPRQRYCDCNYRLLAPHNLK